MVAIAATILAGLIWPGIMVVIPVTIGVLYIASAAGAIREWRPLMWLACLISIGVAVLSTAAVSANDFAVFQLSSDMGDPGKSCQQKIKGRFWPLTNIYFTLCPSDIRITLHTLPANAYPGFGQETPSDLHSLRSLCRSARRHRDQPVFRF